jgi:hypothetical protein
MLLRVFSSLFNQWERSTKKKTSFLPVPVDLAANASPFNRCFGMIPLLPSREEEQEEQEQEEEEAGR